LGVSKVQKPRIFTTLLDLTPKQTKSLKQMNAAIEDGNKIRFEDCTHLVTNSLTRTIKFLMAVAHGLHIVTEDWVKRSIEARKFLEPFQLRDLEKEKHFNFKLQDALTSVRNKQQVFTDHIFHITKRVTLPFPEIEKIIKANGGKAVEGVSSRSLASKGKRHVISCVEDRDTWAPLLHSQPNQPIHTQELILMAALKQKIEWGTNRVEGSILD